MTLLNFRVPVLMVMMLLGTGVGAVGSKALAKNGESRVEKVSLTVDASFPAQLRLKNLHDWQTFESLVLHNTMSRLIRFRGNVPTPELAQSWEVTADMLTYTFSLRDDARFADGTPMTSKDVLFSIKRHLVQNGQYAYRLLPALLENEKLKSVDSDIAGLQAPNPHTVVFKLKEPRPTLVEEMSKLSFGIFKAHSVSPTEDTFDEKFVSSGPYMIREFTKTGVTLTLNPHHWMNKGNSRMVPEIHVIPASKTHSVARLVAGEVDFSRVDGSLAELKQLRERGFGEVVAGPTVLYLACDFSGPSFRKEPALARLIHQALDRTTMVERLNKETGHDFTPASAITGNIESLVRSEEARISEVMRAQAQARLKEIFSSAKSSAMTFTMAVADNNKERQHLAKLISEQLAKYGVKSEIKLMPFSALSGNTNRGVFDGAFIAHGLDAKTPGGALQFLAGTSPSTSNLPGEHPLFQFYKKIPLARTHEDHLALVREYNELNLQTGFIIPLSRSSYYNVFSPKFDVSGLPLFEGNWRASDLRVK